MSAGVTRSAPDRRGGVAAPSPEPVTALLICGSGRSGSTLLERLLQQAGDVVAVGELTELFRLARTRGERCGCGELLRECPFWNDVVAAAFGGWDGAQRGWLAAGGDSASRQRALPRALARAALPSRRAGVSEQTRLYERLYEAISEVSGNRVVVDASKWPSHAYLVRQARNVDLRVLHLVRDPRAVAYSWSKTAARPHAGAGGESTHMPRLTALGSAVRWSGFNLLTEALSIGRPRELLRYEDLIADPRTTVRRCLEHAEITPTDSDLAFISDRAVTLRPGHGLAGNPMRFRHGSVPLTPDDAWRRRLPRGRRLLVEALTGPLELRYRRRASGGTR